MTDDANKSNSELDDLDAQLDALLNDLEASDEALKDARVEDESTLEDFENLLTSAQKAAQGSDATEPAAVADNDDGEIDFDKLAATVAEAQRIADSVDASDAESDEPAAVVDGDDSKPTIDDEAAHALAEQVLEQAAAERASVREQSASTDEVAIAAAKAPAASASATAPTKPAPAPAPAPAVAAAPIAVAPAPAVEATSDEAAEQPEKETYNDAESLKAALDDMFAEIEGKPAAEAQTPAAAVAEEHTQDTAVSAAPVEAIANDSADVVDRPDAGDGEALSMDDLQSQLDELLSDGNSHAALEEAQQLINDAAAGDNDDTIVTADTAEQEDAAALAAKDDDLVSQIQELLDDAKAAQADIDSAYTAPRNDADADAEDVAADPDEAMLEGDFETVEAAVDDAAQAVAPNAEAAPEADAALDAIDTMLAEQAEDAIDGDFDTPEDVLAGGRAAPRVAGRSEGVEEDVKPMQADEPELEGSFDAPDELANASDAPDNTIVGLDEADADSVFDASADDVAAELDSQPETKKRRAAAAKDEHDDEPPASRPASIRDRLAELARDLHPTRISEQTQTLKTVCEAVNSPLDRLSPGTRDMIGYVGLITLFNATVLIAFRIAMSFLA